METEPMRSVTVRITIEHNDGLRAIMFQTRFSGS
jgi:hypothetical protein